MSGGPRITVSRRENFATMAEAEPPGELRDHLLALAVQYDDLGAQLVKP